MILSDFLIKGLQIAILDLALCADNIGLIALATQRLSPKNAKRARFWGVMGAIALRIYFAYFISFFLKLDWFPLKLIGGAILIKVSLDLLLKNNMTEHTRSVKENERFFDAVISIIVADLTMSLDNVLAIAGASGNNLILIALGIALNIPIIFFGSSFVSRLMDQYKIVTYAGTSILIFTALDMMLKDPFLLKYITIPNSTVFIISITGSILTFLYGMITSRQGSKLAHIRHIQNITNI